MEDAQRRLLGFLPEGAACRRVRTKDDGACSLHAAFGSLDARSGCVCAEARARAAEALEAFLRSVSADDFAEELRRASSVSSKVVAAFWGMALKRGFAGDEGPEARLWWGACPQGVRDRVGDVVRRHEEAVALQDANFRDFTDVGREVCVSWGNAGLLVRRIALEVHGLDVGSLPGDIESICDSQLHQWLGPAFDAVRGQLIVKGTASTPIPFPDDGPANKYLALFDARPAFDVLRKAFFITGNSHMQERMVEILCECEGHARDADVMERFRHMLLTDVHNVNPVPGMFEGFELEAVSTFARACLQPSYWLSYDELLLLADLLGEAVVVLEVRGGAARFVGSSRISAGKPVALVGIQSHRRGRVRSHFERLVVVPGSRRAIADGGGPVQGLLKRRRGSAPSAPGNR